MEWAEGAIIKTVLEGPRMTPITMKGALKSCPTIRAGLTMIRPCDLSRMTASSQTTQTIIRRNEIHMGELCFDIGCGPWSFSVHTRSKHLLFICFDFSLSRFLSW